MDFKELGWGDMDVIGVAQDRNRLWELMNAVKNLRFP
jgi:hypothetical protein